MIITSSRGIRLGVVAWLIAAIALTGLRGVRWDENHEFAQVLSGAVVYPEGHPLPHYAASAFSGQTALHALVYAATRSDGLANGLRNVLYLLATVLPVYLIAAFAARAALAGHIAAIFALLGLLTEFDGTYPHGPWPWLYSNGHVGTAWVLVCLTLLAVDARRAALVCLGLMPFVHVGQAPLILLLAGGVLGLPLLRRAPGAWARLPGDAAAFAVGLAPALLLACWVVAGSSPSSQLPGYLVQGDAAAIWRGYTTWYDLHRWFPQANAHVTLAAGLGIGLLAFGVAPRGARRFHGRVLAYIVLVAAVVWLAVLLRQLLPDFRVFWIEIWMPFRLVNHVAPVLLAVCVASLWSARAGRVLLFAVVLAALLRPFLGVLLGEALYRRYLFSGEALLFAMIGGAAVLLAERLSPRRRSVALLSVGLGVAALAFVHQFGAACMLCGGGLALALRSWPRFRVPVPALAVGAAVVLALAAWNEWRHREHLHATVFQRSMAAYLHEHLPSGALLLAELDVYGLQARLGVPVFADAATASYISYAPHLGPVINQMLSEVYGLRLDVAVNPAPPRHWTDRTEEGLEKLAADYGIAFVLVPPTCDLPFTLALEAPEGRLYRIP